MAVKAKLTIEEQINRAKDGRSQSHIVRKLNEVGVEMTDVNFSRKKKGWFEMSEVDFSNKKNGVTFSPEELKALSEILGTPIEA